MRLASQQPFSAAPIFVPSPLVGEGSTGQQSNLVRERGSRTLCSRLWLPLSRLERFAFDPPSPARLRCATPVGEGTINAFFGAPS